jgi:hypothetical protein
LNFDRKTIGIPLKDQIQLNAKVENLKEVIVSNKEKSKRKIVGTKTETESLLIYFTS